MQIFYQDILAEDLGIEILLLDIDEIPIYIGYKLINDILFKNKQYESLKNWYIKAGIGYNYFTITDGGLFLRNSKLVVFKMEDYLRTQLI